MENNNLGAIALLIAVIFTGYLLISRPVGLGGFGGQDTYFTSDLTHSSTTVSNAKRSIYAASSTYRWIISTSTNLGTPTLLKDANTGRQVLDCYARNAIRIWFANTTSTLMVRGDESDGFFVATSTRFNMKDYGMVWPGKIWAMGDSVTSTVSCIEN